MATTRIQLTEQEKNKVYGYLGVGLVLCVTGAILLVTASIKRQFLALPDNFLDPKQLRELLQDDRKHDAMFNAGVAILTAGLLLMFGFGITEFMSGLVVTS